MRQSFLRAPKLASKRGLLTVKFTGGINSQIDDSYLPQNVSKVSYNCSGESGALREAFGIEKFTISDGSVTTPLIIGNASIARVWYFEPSIGVAQYLIETMDKRLYKVGVSVGEVSLTSICVRQLQGYAQAVAYNLNGTNCMLFSSNKDEMYVYNGESGYFVEGSPNISSMCVHYERLFGCGGTNTLWFSDDLDPTNWTISINEAGYIEMADERGALFKVISFADYVYVFRAHGIARVSAYSAQTDFSVTQLFVTSGKIYPETVAVCGDKILFLSDDGLYTFNGIDTKRVLENLKGLFVKSNDSACGVYHDGKYFVACRLDFNDDKKIMCERYNNGYRNNAILSLDLCSGNYVIMRGMDVSSFYACNAEGVSRLLMCFNGEHENTVGQLTDNGKMFDDNLPKRWVCPTTDLGGRNFSDKVADYLIVDTRYDITLSVTCDNKTVYYHINGQVSAQKIPLKLCGKVFRLSISTDYNKLYLITVKLAYSSFKGEI